MNNALNRADFVRPIALAVSFTAAGELLYFVIWGLILFPGGSIASKLFWATTCAAAMGLSIGALVAALVIGTKLSQTTAAVLASAIYASVLTFCAVVCAAIDQTYDFFGGGSEPSLFIWSGAVAAFASAPVYGWLLFSQTGRRYMERVDP